MSSDRETIALPGGWYGRPVEDELGWVDLCGPNGECAGSLKEKDVRAFAAALHHPADEKVATQAGDASGGVDVALKEVERVCRIIEPNLFSDDPATAHREASPYKVEYARKLIHDKVAEIARALSPQSAPLGREDAGEGRDARWRNARRQIAELITHARGHPSRSADPYAGDILMAVNDLIDEIIASQPPTDKAGAAVGGRDAIWNEAIAAAIDIADDNTLRYDEILTGLRALRRNRSPHPDDGSVNGKDQGDAA